MKQTRRIKERYAKVAYFNQLAERIVDQVVSKINADIFNMLDKLYGLREHNINEISPQPR
jgi:hypothetical protein